MGTPGIAASLSAAVKIKERNGLSGQALVPRPARTNRPMRRYQIKFLRTDGSIGETEQIAPASPMFESAFSAFSHGTLIATGRGHVAIQDLSPGDKIATQSGTSSPIMWIGSMTIVPKASGIDDAACRLTRIMPDSFGLSRPDANLLTGPGARILTRPNALRDSFGHERVLTPVNDMADSMNVIDVLPQRSLTVYHIALRRHSIIKVAGIEMESYHPGPGFERNMGPNTLALFLSMFPHIKSPQDFGQTDYPRLPLRGV